MSHFPNCGYHLDQYWWECTCGALPTYCGVCGAYARPEEMAELESVVPKFADRLKDLMMRVKAAGKWWKWGQAPPAAPDPRQYNMNMHMCHSCLAKQEEAA